MKYVKLLPWLLVLLFFAAACATQAPAPAEGEQEAEEPEVVEKEEQEMRRVTEEVKLVKQKLTYFPDGVLDQYRVYVYPEEGTRLLEEKLYNAEDALQERVEYVHENGQRMKKNLYNGDGELQRSHDYSYDEAGNLVKDALYDSKEQLQSRSEYRYNEQEKKVEWRVYDNSGDLLSYTEYTYEDGKNTRIENYRPGGTLDDYFVIEYDQQGRKTRSTWYDAKDEIVQYRTFSYSDGGLTQEVVHRANDSVKLRIVYTNNEAGKPVKVQYEDADGDVREIVSYEYVTRTETRMVKAE